MPGCIAWTIEFEVGPQRAVVRTVPAIAFEFAKSPREGTAAQERWVDLLTSCAASVPCAIGHHFCELVHGHFAHITDLVTPILTLDAIAWATGDHRGDAGQEIGVTIGESELARLRKRSAPRDRANRWWHSAEGMPGKHRNPLLSARAQWNVPNAKTR